MEGEYLLKPDVAAEIIILAKCLHCNQIYTHTTEYWTKLYELDKAEGSRRYLDNHFGAIKEALISGLFRNNPCPKCRSPKTIDAPKELEG